MNECVPCFIETQPSFIHLLPGARGRGEMMEDDNPRSDSMSLKVKSYYVHPPGVQDQVTPQWKMEPTKLIICHPLDGEEKVPSSSTFSQPLFLSPDEKMCDGVKWKIGVAYYVIISSSRSRKIEIVLHLRHETDVEMKFTLKSSLFALAHHAHKCQIPLKVKTHRGKRDFIKFRPRHFGGFFSADWKGGGGGEWRVALRLTVGNDDDDDNRSGVPFLSTRSS